MLRIYKELDAAFGLERWNISWAETVPDGESSMDGCTTAVSFIFGKSVKEDAQQAP